MKRHAPRVNRASFQVDVGEQVFVVVFDNAADRIQLVADGDELLEIKNPHRQGGRPHKPRTHDAVSIVQSYLDRRREGS